MRTLASILATGIAALTLTACGGVSGNGSLTSGSSGSGSGSGSGAGNTTGNGGSTSAPPVYSMGSGTGSAFQAGMMGLSSTSLSAGGTTSLTVTIVDKTGTLYSGTAVTVTFSSPCFSQGLATIVASGTSTPGSAAGQVSTTSGTATATYTAKGCSGPDVISAQALVSNQTLTAGGTVTVAAAAIGSIQFVSATPTTIGLKGTGLGETSTVVFKVVDASGGPRANTSVSFSLNTSAGGLSISPTTASSGADGTVQTVVSAGTVHTAVRVTASIASPALSTQSGVLTVTTGLPTSNAFSISVGAPSYASNGPACPNVEAYSLYQITVPITVQLADRYANPAPDGTAVAFTSSGGVIVGSCTTPLATPGDGACKVTWTSGNPLPDPANAPPSYRKGRAMILATAIGEEYFDDVSGSGYYVAGDPFADLGEPYRDDNENGKYDLGEHYLDFNHNGTRDGPSGQFIGITCTGSTPGASCSTSTLAIGASHLLIMSTSGASISSSVSSISIAHSVSGGATSATSFTFSVQDTNGNPMAAGTTVSVGADSGIGSVSGQTSWTIGCRSGGGPGGSGADTLGVTFTAGTSAGASGSITISVTSPGTKTVSQAVIPVNVT